VSLSLHTEEENVKYKRNRNVKKTIIKKEEIKYKERNEIVEQCYGIQDSRQQDTNGRV
jgi:hypothetical protein